jgi:hypothetical protein
VAGRWLLRVYPPLSSSRHLVESLLDKILLTFYCLCELAVGMEANPFCLARCVSLFASSRSRFKPHATVEWCSRDISTLQWTDVCAYAHPQHVVVYAYLGGAQLLKLRPLVAMLLCAGSRVITYDTHFQDIDSSEEVLVEKKYGELLRMRQVIRPRTESTLTGGFLLTPSKLRLAEPTGEPQHAKGSDGKLEAARERRQRRTVLPTPVGVSGSAVTGTGSGPGDLAHTSPKSKSNPSHADKGNQAKVSADRTRRGSVITSGPPQATTTTPRRIVKV